MSISGILMFLGISCALAAYLFYALVSVPSDIEERDAVFWIFVKHKSSRGIVSVCDLIAVA